MEDSSSKGKGLAIIAGVYIIIKTVINMAIGGFSLSDTLIALGMFAFLVSGIKFMNFIIAGIMVLVVASHFMHNISDIGANLIYIIEAVIDIAIASMLCFSSDVKAFFGENSSDT